MNIKILDSWLRELVETDATPEEIKNYLSLCGPTVEKISGSEKNLAYEIEVTTNRVDMMSAVGIAREMTAILPRFGIKAAFSKKFYELNGLKKNNIIKANSLPISISDPHALCKRVLGVVLENVSIKPSPETISQRLETAGIRSLNNVIDITNYVMTEMGHPCHVFDYNRIQTARLIIRRAKKGEKLVTLDEKVYALTGEDVIIDDGTGRIIDLPGIMGTENSVVTSDTKRVLLFIESNNPLIIRKTSMRLGIRTVAAAINEKSPDPNCAELALVRGVNLLEELAGAKVASSVIDIYKNPPQKHSLMVTKKFITDRLGIDVAAKEISSILSSLQFKVEEKSNKNDTVFAVTPPSWRKEDVEIPEDVVEEVARIYGYHRLPNKIMAGEIPLAQKPVDLVWEEKVKNILKSFGLTEILSYSFLSHELLEKTGLGHLKTLKLANPLSSDWTTMRPSLIPEMLQTLSENNKRKETLKLFELSKVYLPKENDLPKEEDRLCLGFINVGYRAVRGILEALTNETGLGNFVIKPGALAQVPFGKTADADIFVDEKKVGKMGKVTANIANNLNLQEIYLVDLSFTQLVPLFKPTKNYQVISTYPPFIEDLALIVKPRTHLGDLITSIKNFSDLISSVVLLDEYENTKTLRIVYQNAEKELSNEEVKFLREKIIKLVGEKFGARLKI